MVGSVWKLATPPCAQPLQGLFLLVLLFLLFFICAEPAAGGSTLFGGIAVREP